MSRVAATTDIDEPIRLKVFGERNSGTTAAEQALKAYPGARLLPSVAPPAVRGFARLAGRQRERVLDAWDAANRRRTLGWKHAYLDERIEFLMETRRVRGIALVRHPLSWITALRRRQYHLAELGGVLSHVPLGREHLPRDPQSLFDVWSMKAERYVELRDRGLVAIVRFENFVSRPNSTLGEAIVSLGLPAPVESLVLPDQSVKGDARSLSDIRDYYADELWRADVLPADQSQVDRLLPLLHRLGYDEPPTPEQPRQGPP